MKRWNKLELQNEEPTRGGKPDACLIRTTNKVEVGERNRKEAIGKGTLKTTKPGSGEGTEGLKKNARIQTPPEEKDEIVKKS